MGSSLVQTRCRINGCVLGISKPNEDARVGALPCARQFDSTARMVPGALRPTLLRDEDTLVLGLGS